jgi:Na+-driven multidrug efflux pump
MPAMIVSIAGSIARYPLAYYIAFTLDAGVSGVWWSITLTTVVKGLILMYWFSRGKWKTKELRG